MSDRNIYEPMGPRCVYPRGVQVYLTHENPPSPWNSAVALCLGPYGGPGVGGRFPMSEVPLWCSAATTRVAHAVGGSGGGLSSHTVPSVALSTRFPDPASSCVREIFFTGVPHLQENATP